MTHASTEELALDTRTRLLHGALDCIRRGARVSFADVARSSGVARQTIYAYFPDRDSLTNAAVDFAAIQVTRDVIARTESCDSAADALVEALVAFYLAAKTDPAVGQVVAMTLHPRTADRGTIPSEAMRLVRSFVRPRLVIGRSDAELDEVAEVFLRYLLSVLAYSSTNTETVESLRTFLQRRMVPALGLD
ncbi:hypothetical protein Back2_28060 [Nocardioides baekrokdamisoli]|uniref:HTH tetR-type domain-containing protein n=1 Tax=Nocardioides baekrokdamisoli TaxID=1804624 RepID=A0A3G9J677_9ACTN|nr:TetR/AcrR family transcriptional regulator [Nocardioides baekrokdamisoli]BBH18519.1 hypothetical protein Back2_28060 [Nocardioides baekrokdamisoli]